MTTCKRVNWLALLTVCGVFLHGCSDREQTPATMQTQVESQPSLTAEAAPSLRLPISLNELMVALVNEAADPIWVADWQRPETDAEWRWLEIMARQLQIAGPLLKIPGTGPVDDTWTADVRWQGFADRLTQIGKQTQAAVQSRDATAIRLAGDDLVQLCEDCHIAFKPDIPTGRLYGEPSPLPPINGN